MKYLILLLLALPLAGKAQGSSPNPPVILYSLAQLPPMDSITAKNDYIAVIYDSLNNRTGNLTWQRPQNGMSSFMSIGGAQGPSGILDIRNAPEWPNDSTAGANGVQPGDLYKTLTNTDLIIKMKR